VERERIGGSNADSMDKDVFLGILDCIIGGVWSFNDLDIHFSIQGQEFIILSCVSANYVGVSCDILWGACRRLSG
jgi:hypothetical protein